MQKNRRGLGKVQTTTKTKRTRKRAMDNFERAAHINKLCKEEHKEFVNRFGTSLPVRGVSCPLFIEKPFGTSYKLGQDGWCQLSEEVASSLSLCVVSLALFDGEDLLFACTGIVLPQGTSRLHMTRYLTSACLVAEFNKNRNRDDELRVEVRLPNKKLTDGFLELYNEEIAIVASMNFVEACPLNLDHQEICDPDATSTVAVGRAFSSCSLMGMVGTLNDGSKGVFPRRITVAGLGGPLVDLNGNFVGVTTCRDGGTRKILFLSRTSVRKCLEQFKIIPSEAAALIPWYKRARSLSGETKNSCQEYSAPPGASHIIPSGFMMKSKLLESLGYPMRPPLMVEMGGQLIHTFEDLFGWQRAWNTYEFFVSRFGFGRNPWVFFDHKKITPIISRRVVSLSSFKGDVRFFACTGLLIKFPVKTRMLTCSARPMQTVILTSASLVRTCDEEDTIDDKLKIKVFLPPNQRFDGKLELYHSSYNIAIISVEGLRGIRPETIGLETIGYMEPSVEDLHKKDVVAIGREPTEGLLCGSWGKVTDGPITHDCKELKLSSCRIKKAGIGGPLINMDDGSFVGMNFYDGITKGTPFLPRSKICEVLQMAALPSARERRRGDYPASRLDNADGINNINRWPVPKVKWYHGQLEVDMFDPLPLPRGRVLH